MPKSKEGAPKANESESEADVLESGKPRKPRPTKKVAQLTIVDTSELAEGEVYDAANSEMTETRAEHEAKGLKEKIPVIVKRLWKHNLFREYYRLKAVREARGKIIGKDNLYGARTEERVAHEEAMSAVLARFVHEVPEVSLLAEGEVRRALGDRVPETSGREKKKEGIRNIEQFQSRLKDLITRYATGALGTGDAGDEALRQEKIRLFNEFKVAQEVGGKGLMFADNLLEIARNARDSVAHHGGLEALDLELKVVLGKAKSALRTSVDVRSPDTMTEKAVELLRSTGLANELVAQLAVGGVASVLAKIPAMAKSKIFAHATFGASAVVGGLVAGVREYKQVGRERGQHARDRAKGEVRDPGALPKRRAEMEGVMYELVSAREYSERLREALTRDEEGSTVVVPGHEAEVTEILADIDARIALADSRKIDLFKFSSTERVEVERTELDLMRASARVALRKSVARADAEVGALSGVIRERILKGTERSPGVEAQDDRFNALRRTKTAGMVAKGIIAGIAVAGIIRGAQWAIGEAGHLLHHGPDFSTATDLGEKAGARVAGESVDFHTETVNGMEVALPEGYSVHENPDGTFDLLSGGSVVAKHLGIDAHGTLTPESTEALKAIGAGGVAEDVHVAADVPGAVSAHEYVATHSAETHHVQRVLWYDNNTPKPIFENNELRLDWGGAHNSGMDAQGNYVFNIGRMSPDGSFHGGLSADAQELMKEGKLKMLFSLSRDTQSQVFEVPIDTNGNAVIDPTSELGKIAFAQADGHAQFLGQYAEVAQVVGNEQGAEQVRILATHVGGGLGEVPTMVQGAELAHKITIVPPLQEEAAPIAPLPETPDASPWWRKLWFIPMPRRPLERLENTPQKSSNDPQGRKQLSSGEEPAPDTAKKGGLSMEEYAALERANNVERETQEDIKQGDFFAEQYFARAEDPEAQRASLRKHIRESAVGRKVMDAGEDIAKGGFSLPWKFYYAALRRAAREEGYILGLARVHRTVEKVMVSGKEVERESAYIMATLVRRGEKVPPSTPPAETSAPQEDVVEGEFSEVEPEEPKFFTEPTGRDKREAAKFWKEHKDTETEYRARMLAYIEASITTGHLDVPVQERLFGVAKSPAAREDRAWLSAYRVLALESGYEVGEFVLSETPQNSEGLFYATAPIRRKESASTVPPPQPETPKVAAVTKIIEGPKAPEGESKGSEQDSDTKESPEQSFEFLDSLRPEDVRYAKDFWTKATNPEKQKAVMLERIEKSLSSGQIVLTVDGRKGLARADLEKLSAFRVLAEENGYQIGFYDRIPGTNRMRAGIRRREGGATKTPDGTDGSSGEEETTKPLEALDEEKIHSLGDLSRALAGEDSIMAGERIMTRAALRNELTLAYNLVVRRAKNEIEKGESDGKSLDEYITEEARKWEGVANVSSVWERVVRSRVQEIMTAADRERLEPTEYGLGGSPEEDVPYASRYWTYLEKLGGDTYQRRMRQMLAEIGRAKDFGHQMFEVTLPLERIKEITSAQKRRDFARERFAAYRELLMKEGFAWREFIHDERKPNSYWMQLVPDESAPEGVSDTVAERLKRLSGAPRVYSAKAKGPAKRTESADEGYVPEEISVEGEKESVMEKVMLDALEQSGVLEVRTKGESLSKKEKNTLARLAAFAKVRGISLGAFTFDASRNMYVAEKAAQSLPEVAPETTGTAPDEVAEVAERVPFEFDAALAEKYWGNLSTESQANRARAIEIIRESPNEVFDVLEGRGDIETYSESERSFVAAMLGIAREVYDTADVFWNRSTKKFEFSVGDLRPDYREAAKDKQAPEEIKGDIRDALEHIDAIGRELANREGKQLFTRLYTEDRERLTSSVRDLAAVINNNEGVSSADLAVVLNKFFVEGQSILGGFSKVKTGGRVVEDGDSLRTLGREFSLAAERFNKLSADLSSVAEFQTAATAAAAFATSLAARARSIRGNLGALNRYLEK